MLSRFSAESQQILSRVLADSQQSQQILSIFSAESQQSLGRVSAESQRSLSRFAADSQQTLSRFQIFRRFSAYIILIAALGTESLFSLVELAITFFSGFEGSTNFHILMHMPIGSYHININPTKGNVGSI